MINSFQPQSPIVVNGEASVILALVAARVALPEVKRLNPVEHPFLLLLLNFWRRFVAMNVGKVLISVTQIAMGASL